MRALATRYLNEIVGLAVMALMIVALIAAQARGTLPQLETRSADATTRFVAADPAAE